MRLTDIGIWFLIAPVLVILSPSISLCQNIDRAIANANIGVVITKLHRSGFGSVMIADFNIVNRTERDIKDIEVECVGYAKSGTEISVNSRMIYDVFPKNSFKVIKDFNMGLIHSQVVETRCRCVGLKFK